MCELGVFFVVPLTEVNETTKNTDGQAIAKEKERERGRGWESERVRVSERVREEGRDAKQLWIKNKNILWIYENDPIC